MEATAPVMNALSYRNELRLLLNLRVQRILHEVAAPRKSTSAIIRLSDAFTVTLECSAGDAFSPSSFHCRQ